MENNTSAPVCEQPYEVDMGVTVGRTVGLSLAGVASLVGNLLVLIIFKRNPSTRTNTNFFIVNMAAADLLLPIFGLPFRLVKILLGPGRFLIGGPIGEFLCKISPFIESVSLSVSIQSLVLIAVERFIAVVYPLKAVTISPRRRTRLIFVTWVVAAVLNSSHWFFYRLQTTCNRSFCVLPLHSNSANVIYRAVMLILHVAFPLLVIVCLYTAILIKLKRMKVPGDQSSQADRRQRERNSNITNMSVCIVLAFAICCLPVYVGVMLRLSPTSTTPTFKYVALNLGYFNGAVNPWILFYFSGNFRRGLRDMFGCNGCCCQTSDRVVEQNNELEIIEGNAR